jgi:hypothetical protein
VFAHFVSTSPKKLFFSCPLGYLVLIYTPKEAHGQIFVTGGSFLAQQMMAKNGFLGRQACSQ